MQLRSPLGRVSIEKLGLGLVLTVMSIINPISPRFMFKCLSDDRFHKIILAFPVWRSEDYNKLILHTILDATTILSRTEQVLNIKNKFSGILEFLLILDPFPLSKYINRFLIVLSRVYPSIVVVFVVY